MRHTWESGYVFEFGKFRLDPNEKTLLSDGSPVHLALKEIETLLLLVENSDHVLSKDEMISAIWPDSFVEEGNLAKQISRLRKVLDHNGQEYIETLPKRGYRFSAPDLRRVPKADELPVIIENRTVRRVGIEIGPAAKPVTERLLPAGSTSGRRIAAAVVLLILGGLSAGTYLWLTRTVSPNASGSLAILPFRSVGTETDDEYLCLGLTDALITKLGTLKTVVVRPTNAVRPYSGHDPLAAGRELGVDAVLDGNVQRIDQQIRVTVQLINVSDGTLLWGGKFDEEFTDIFAIQDAISAQVALALAPGLTGDERSLLAKRYTTNPDAHQAYVRGRLLWNRRTANDLRAAIDLFNEAIEKDPNYALAYAGLADAYSLLSDYSGAAPDEAYPKAKEAALKALELDDQLAEAHTALAYVNMHYHWDWQGAENEYRRAVAINPNYASARQWYAEYLTAMGRFDEALAEIRRAREIDPLSPIINAGEVWTLYFARRYDEAIERGKAIAEIDPKFAEIHEYLKRCYDQKEMYPEAIAARQMRRKLAGVGSAETDILKQAAAGGKEEYWQKRLQQEIVDARSEPTAVFNMAEIYAQLRDKDLAFEWLEKAVAKRHYEVVYLRVAPNLDPLRSDPRFTTLLHRVGL